MNYELINLGIVENPKSINIGTCYSLTEIHANICLFEQYMDVFVQSYDNWKAYDTTIIQHGIPLREGVKPLQQRSMKVHLTLEPLM